MLRADTSQPTAKANIGRRMLQSTYFDPPTPCVPLNVGCRTANNASHSDTPTLECRTLVKFALWSLASVLAVGIGLGNLANGAQGVAILPGSFVYLRDIDPTILQDIRYAQLDNFMGRRVPGYEADECILLRRAAEALARVQADLRSKQLSLKVYDCYRPARAVRAFVAWGELPDDGATKRFYPRLDKRSLFGLGYIARQSGHTRGDTVDVTLVVHPPGSTAAFDPAHRYGPCTGSFSSRAPDNGVDMGTGFDCFDAMSHTSSSVTSEQSRWRGTLVSAMSRHGFRNFAREWWHFTLGSSSAKTGFDFPIRARGRSAPDPKTDKRPAADQ
jgi:zinc D-Ala-D-Ala dipeptidase